MYNRSGGRIHKMVTQSSEFFDLSQGYVLDIVQCSFPFHRFQSDHMLTALWVLAH